VTRAEFLALPLGMQTAILFDQMPQRMAALQAPRVPLPPKFDGRVSRKGGYCWMSEMDLSGLQYWHGRKSEDTKPEFADRNAKDLKALSYWIEWRTADPQSTWSGERNRQPVRAKPPSRDPEIHQWEPKNTNNSAPSSDDYSGGASDDTSYGF
jgi:hypothetical protein